MHPSVACLYQTPRCRPHAGQPRQTYPARFDALLVRGPGLNGTLMGFNFLGSLEPDGRRSASHKHQSRRAVRRSKDNGCGSLRPPRGCRRLQGSVHSDLHLWWTRSLQPRSHSRPCFTFNQSVERQFIRTSWSIKRVEANVNVLGSEEGVKAAFKRLRSRDMNGSLPSVWVLAIPQPHLGLHKAGMPESTPLDPRFLSYQVHTWDAMLLTGSLFCLVRPTLARLGPLRTGFGHLKETSMPPNTVSDQCFPLGFLSSVYNSLP